VRAQSVLLFQLLFNHLLELFASAAQVLKVMGVASDINFID